MLDDLWQDGRLALRRLIRAPLFSLATVAILALGIGANTAVFSLLNAVVLRSLQIKEPDRLVAVSRVNASGQVRFMPAATVAEFARRQSVFERVAAYTSGPGLTVEVNGAFAPRQVELVDGSYYSVLGVRPQLGRLIDEGDRPLTADAAPVVVLAFQFWQRRLGGDPAVLGQSLRVSGVPLTIIGVTPPEFSGLQTAVAADLTVPLALLNRLLGQPANPSRPLEAGYIIGRLRHGITAREARAQVNALWMSVQDATVPPGLASQQAQEARALRPRVEAAGAGFSFLRSSFSSTLYLLVALTGLLLLLMCANLAGLLTTRAAGRARELAVQMALGASRRRLVQPLLAESVLIVAVGALIAVPFAWWTSESIGAALWAGVPVTFAATPDRRVLVVTAAVALFVAGAGGLVPGYVATSRLGRAALRPTPTVTRVAAGRWTRLLLVCQIAISLALLFGAGLLTTSLRNLLRTERGFDSSGVLIARVGVRPGAYRDIAEAAYYPELVRRLSELPGVQRVSLARQFTYVFNNTLPPQAVAAVGSGGRSAEVGARVDAVSPGFFETMRIPLVQGRDFAWSDDSRSAPAVVVDAYLARELFPGESAIGRRIRVGADPALRDIMVVGVVGDARFGSIRTPLPTVYRSWLQAGAYGRYPIIQLRTMVAPSSMSEAVDRTISSLGREFVMEMRTLDAQIQNALGRERVAAALAMMFGALAACLALVGIYGLLAYVVAQRTREIGVRIALGASRTQVLRLIMWQGLAISAVGVLAGVPLALAVERLARALLYGADTANTPILFAAALLVVVTGGTAGLLPALRTLHVDPMTALRDE